MKLIQEAVENVDCLIESVENGKKNFYIEGIFLQGNIKNRNGRRYPTEILDREVNRYVKEKVDKDCAVGELGHPDGPSINLDRVSHKFEYLKRDGNNFTGRAKIITGTPMGKIAAGLMEAGVKLGVSSRGLGNVSTAKDGVPEVDSSFLLTTAGDIVSDPSAPDAWVDNIMEGSDWVYVDGRGWITQEAKHQINRAIRENKYDKTKRENQLIEAFSNYLKNISTLK